MPNLKKSESSDQTQRKDSLIDPYNKSSEEPENNDNEAAFSIKKNP